MSGEALAPARWLDAALDATEELAKTVLGCSDFCVGERDTPKTENLTCAYIPLISRSQAFQLGFAATRDSCEALTKNLLGMEEDEDAGELDVADAVGEIVNIVAGGVQIRLADSALVIELGLPILTNGGIYALPTQETVGAEVKMDAVDAVIVLVCEKNSS